MATLQELERALVNADRAGDSDAARRLAAAITEARKSATNLIPGAAVPETMPTPEAPGIGAQIVGAGEAGLSAATGTLGYLAGLAAGGNEFVKALLYGATGTQPAPGQMPDPSKAFEQTSQALTYQPRTQAGQEITRGLADVAGQLAPLPGLQAESALLARAAEQGARTVAPVVRATAQRAAIEVPAATSAAYQAARSRINQAFGMSDDVARTDGGSVGAAGVERARRLTETAEQLPIPVRLTKGESTGDLEQIRFEQEQAKGALGAPIRERSAATNRALAQNFDALIDKTGAETASFLEAGRTVSTELKRASDAEKARYKSLYRQAEEAGELRAPVNLDALVSYLNEAAPEAATSPLVTTARNLAVKLGIAKDEGGVLVPTRAGRANTMTNEPAPNKVTLKTAENFRSAINKNTGFEAPNIRQATIIKRLIDEATSEQGGDLYRNARRARQRYAELFEDNAIVADLIETKRGTADRKVALEDVFRRTILNGSNDDLRRLRTTLSIADQRQGIAPMTTGSGAQAWKELQGSTLRYLLDEAQKGFGVAADGAPRFSGAQLNAALRNLERGNKLEFVLGKQRAQAVRDIAEIARAVQSFPPGAVNTSNTASVILGALAEAGATGAMTGLPLPAVSLLRAGAQAIKDKKTRARIQASLNYRPETK